MKPQAVAAAILLAGAVLCHAQVPVPGYPSPPRCGHGELLMQCQSSTCAELTCANPTPPTKCSNDCHTACFCANGFYRNSAGHCVRRDLCS
ncbi:hypothetical protein MTO96_037603 [Rhipicephalus appendiculatus]